MGTMALVVCLPACCSFGCHTRHEGASLAFISQSADEGRLCVIGADGTGRWEFGGDRPLSVGIMTPRWSPDGTRLAIVVGQYSGAADPPPDAIYLVKPYRDTYAAIHTEADAERMIVDVSWAPEGDRLAFVSAPGVIWFPPRPAAERAWQLWVIGSSGGSPTRISEEGVETSTPVWSPDGQRIAYVEERLARPEEGRREWTPRIVVAETRSWEQTTTILGSPSLSLEAWSPVPSSDQILFSTWGSHGGAHGDWVCIADVSTRVTRYLAVGSLPAWPRWSPDGASVAFAADREGRAQLAMIGADGEGEALLTESTGNDTCPS